MEVGHIVAQHTSFVLDAISGFIQSAALADQRILLVQFAPFVGRVFDALLDHILGWMHFQSIEAFLSWTIITEKFDEAATERKCGHEESETNEDLLC